MAYNRETIIEKNITLSFEFERYVLEDPNLLLQLPPGAEVVLLPKDDPELYRINLETSQQALLNDTSLSVVYVEIEALAPPRSRLVNPHLTPRPSLSLST